MMPGVQVPHVFTVEELVEHFVEAGGPTAEQLGEALLRLDRNLGPGLLADLEAEGLLKANVAAAHVGSVWSMAEYPDRHLDRESWRALFSLAGYTVNGTPAGWPTEALTLYRGSVPDRRADWSWTDKLEVATRYATGGIGYRPTHGKVWQAEVEPHRLLARNDDAAGRNESEYVVDTEDLVIIENCT